MHDDNSKLIVLTGCAILCSILGFIMNFGACTFGIVVGICFYGASCR